MKDYPHYIEYIRINCLVNGGQMNDLDLVLNLL